MAQHSTMHLRRSNLSGISGTAWRLEVHNGDARNIDGSEYSGALDKRCV